MKHILGAIFQLITMGINYATLIVVILFDSIIFGLPAMWINNNVLVSVYSVPKVDYFSAVCILFLIKLIALIIKSINIKED